MKYVATYAHTRLRRQSITSIQSMLVFINTFDAFINYILIRFRRHFIILIPFLPTEITQRPAIYRSIAIFGWWMCLDTRSLTHHFAMHLRTVPSTSNGAKIVDVPSRKAENNIWPDWNRTWSEIMSPDAAVVRHFYVLMMATLSSRRHPFPIWSPNYGFEILKSNWPDTGAECRLFQMMLSISTISWSDPRTRK